MDSNPHSEYIAVIPGDPSLKQERRAIDLVLRSRHYAEFQ